MERLLSRREVQRTLGQISLSTFKRMRRSGELPAPIKISARRVGWQESAIAEFIRSKLEGEK